MILQKWEELEADWQGVYGRDLGQDCFGREPVSMRWLLVRVKHLPGDSAFKRSFSDGIPVTWEGEMLVTLVEMQHAAIRVALRAAGAKRHQVPRPLTVTRPWSQLLESEYHQVPEQVKRPGTPARVLANHFRQLGADVHVEGAPDE